MKSVCFCASKRGVYNADTDATIAESTTSVSTTFTTPQNCWLFGASGTVWTGNKFSGRIYGFTISTNDVARMDLVPCCRQSDGAVGFYDTVGQAFLQNSAGSGSFTVASDFTVDPIPSRIYPGGTVEPPVTVRDRTSGAVLSTTEYDLTYANNAALGIATVTVVGKGGHTGVVKVDFALMDLLMVKPDASVTGGEEAASNRTAEVVSVLDGIVKGDCLKIDNSAAVEIERIRFTRAKSRAINKTGVGDLTIWNCAFINNGRGQKVSGRGMNVVGGSAATLTVSNCVFTGNGDWLSFQPNATTSYGGAIVVNLANATDKVDIKNCTVAYNLSQGTHCPGGINIVKGDVHLRGSAGYIDEHTGTTVSYRKMHSPAIDAGDRNSDCSNEPMPNGRRVNLGAYGNTPWATMSQLKGMLLIFR